MESVKHSIHTIGVAIILVEIRLFPEKIRDKEIEEVVTERRMPVHGMLKFKSDFHPNF